MLFWQIYNNEPGKAFWLIDSAGQRTPCYDLHARFLNGAKVGLGEFKQEHGRLPDDAEFGDLLAPMLNTPLPAPVSLALTNRPATNVRPDAATIPGVVRQGIYGEPWAQVFGCWGTTDGGTSLAAWQHVVDLESNSRFGVATFSTTLTGLQPSQVYYFRFHATNALAQGWSATSATFTTPPRPPRISKIQSLVTSTPTS